MFYVGYSSDPGIRLTKHNSTNSNTFTSKGRPWTSRNKNACNFTRKVYQETKIKNATRESL